VADLELNRAQDIKPVPVTRKEKIGIVGAGPAGLTAAYYLAKNGYRVTVFEAFSRPGGMLVAGIPEYRLPRDVIQAEIDAIAALGVEIKTGVRVGRDISFDDLKKQGHHPLILAVGAHKGKHMGVPGEDDYRGCVNSVEFLRGVNFGEITSVPKAVVVVGGGNSAIDAARVARRLGAEKVTVAYRRTRKEMPAYTEEIEAALEEGIRIEFLVSPVRVVGKGGKVTGLECLRNRLGEPDTSGRRRPEPVEGSEFLIPCNMVIPAISQEPDLTGLNRLEGLDTTPWQTFKVNSATLQTGAEGIFAAGDTVTGPATIIEAVAAGQRVAAAVDKYCRGGRLQWRFKPVIPKRRIEELEVTDEEVEKLKRPSMPHSGMKNRLKTFREVDLGLPEETCIGEAKRCLRCDL
jgi:NADPH-dependent glutamate synthase beta subunit-like oxidoreductase